MSRFGSYSKTPISERINLFGGAIKTTRPTSSAGGKVSEVSEPTTPATTPTAEKPNPLVKSPSKSQFSMKDPSSGRAPAKKLSTTTPPATSPRGSPSTSPVPKAEVTKTSSKGDASKVSNNGNLNKVSHNSPNVQRRQTASPAPGKKVLSRTAPKTQTNSNLSRSPSSSSNSSKSTTSLERTPSSASKTKTNLDRTPSNSSKSITNLERTPSNRSSKGQAKSKASTLNQSNSSSSSSIASSNRGGQSSVKQEHTTQNLTNSQPEKIHKTEEEKVNASAKKPVEPVSQNMAKPAEKSEDEVFIQPEVDQQNESSIKSEAADQQNKEITLSNENITKISSPLPTSENSEELSHELGNFANATSENISNETNLEKTPTVSNETNFERTPKVSNATNFERTPKVSNATNFERTTKVSNATNPEKTPKLSNATNPEKTPKISNASNIENTPKLSISERTPKLSNATNIDKAPKLSNAKPASIVLTVDRNITNVNEVIKTGLEESIVNNNIKNLGTDNNIKTLGTDNIKNLGTLGIDNMKHLGTDNSTQYWTNQALFNANSTTINQAMKLDAEFKEDKLSALQRELSEMQDTGVSDDEVRQLKKSNHDLEMRLKDQEEELDDLAGQVQLLESSKTKLEMQMAQIKKEQRREMQSKEDELEDARAAANKKVKVLEQQLEQEHEERIGFLRERHELEGKIMTLQDMLERAGDEEQLAKLRKDLKRTKALLRDAQLMIEKSHNEGSNKVMIRQLKNQLEDAEFTRTAAMKSKQNAELELADVQQQLDDMIGAKNDLEDRHLKLSREKAEYAGQLQENEEDLQEVMKKYKASVNAVTTDQITIQDQAASIAELEAERNKLRETVAELSTKVESMEGENVTTTQHKRLELKIRELESKLELEQTTRGRLETQISRLKEGIEKLNSESDQLRVKEQSSQEGSKKVNRQLRDLKEDYTNVQTKETEMTQKKSDLEKQLEISEGETVTAKNELKLAMKRIEDLQIAIAGEIDTDETNSEDNSESSDEEMHSFLEHHRRAMSVQRERESMARESVMRDSVAREVRASMAREVSVGRDSSVGRDFSVGRDSSVARDFAVGRSLPATTIREEPDFTSSPNNSITEGDESQA